MNNKGKLYVISGASGTGKSTVIGEMMKSRDDIRFSVSVTTRDPREGEKDGVDYYFVTRSRYDEMVAAGELLEHAVFADNGYGTPRAPVEELLEQGYNVLLDIEVQGAAQVKAAMPESVSIFILPPSMEELEKRLRGRGTENEETILKRLDTARRELPLAENYDHRIVNNYYPEAAAELSALIEKV